MRPCLAFHQVVVVTNLWMFVTEGVLTFITSSLNPPVLPDRNMEEISQNANLDKLLTSVEKFNSVAAACSHIIMKGIKIHLFCVKVLTLQSEKH